jgi:hypothetical protein
MDDINIAEDFPIIIRSDGIARHPRYQSLIICELDKEI